MLFPETVSGASMDTRGYEERQGFGSVKAAIDFYKGKTPDENFPLKKPQAYNSEKPPSKLAELHQARKNTGKLGETKRLAESVKHQAESELLNAKKTVKELRKKIEETNSRAKSQIQDLENIKKTTSGQRDRGTALKDDKNSQFAKVTKELEKAKQDLSSLRVNMASLLEERRRAEKEREASNEKAQYNANLIETLRKEIEQRNEEHVLVELARLEATKERQAIELQKEEAAKQHAARLEETRKKINYMIQETGHIQKLEELLAITYSETNVLESELREVREMDERIQRTKNSRNLGSNLIQREQKESSALVLSITEELEAANKELDGVKAEGIQLMISMDVVRNEIKAIKEETAQLNRKEAKAEMTIQNLNAKLLSITPKLEGASAAAENAQLIVSNLSATLAQFESEVEAARKERIINTEKTNVLKAEVLKTESEIDLAEEKFQAALEELKSVRLSEAEALQNLKMLTQKTMHNRTSASQSSSTITIPTFEYEYLKGSAVRAADIADKKIAAAQAWVEALKASEKEILIKTECVQRENEELRAKEEQEVVRTEQPFSANNVADPERENGRQTTKDIAEQRNTKSQLRLSRKSLTGIKLTPVRRARFHKSGSPAVRARSASFSIKRQRKLMPNLVNFFSGQSVDRNL